MTEYGFLSLIPPVLAIALAIKTRQVIFSLILGIFVGWLIMGNGNLITAFLSTIDAMVNVMQSEGNTRTVIFTLLIGALIQLIRKSGGMNGFIGLIQKRLAKSKSPNSTLQVAAGLTGFLIFIESNISILTVGTAFQSLFDKYKIAREKLAYLADSSSAPSCILFPINAWGAYVMGLLAAYDHLDPFQALLFSIPFNFYPILTLILVFYLAASGKSYGPMKAAEASTVESAPTEAVEETIAEGKASNMIIPLLIMILTMPIYLVYTGWDSSVSEGFGQQLWSSIGNGSGSSAVMYAVVTALLFAGISFGIQKIISFKEFFEESLKGMNEMLLMALLMVLAFAIGNLCNEMQTGIYVAEVTKSWLSPQLAPALVFLISCFVAFATGTSWGTFAIMMSISIPLAQAVGLNPYLAIAAVLGGGVFGDHCSPISDTTLISSMASGTEHIEHVRTQLPYALFTGSLATLLYLVAGFLMV
ncbi:MAG: Na+/H+ antiporter NhaC family protein [Cytophagales bacterium]|nr:Na+/H+ antiporter NhaC family protein [Cytophagales bacterium]